MHAESGYWRPKPDGSIEVVVAQSTGLVEVLVTPCSVNFNMISFCKLLILLCCHVNWIYYQLQKGTSNAEEKVVKLRSELVGNASKVL